MNIEIKASETSLRYKALDEDVSKIEEMKGSVSECMQILIRIKKKSN